MINNAELKNSFVFICDTAAQRYVPVLDSRIHNRCCRDRVCDTFSYEKKKIGKKHCYHPKKEQ